LLDEACAMAVEADAKRIEKEKKNKERHEKFVREMDRAFDDIDD
jgi:hypothetical protein